MFLRDTSFHYAFCEKTSFFPIAKNARKLENHEYSFRYIVAKKNNFRMLSTANLKQIVDWKKKFEHAILLIEKLADLM